MPQSEADAGFGPRLRGKVALIIGGGQMPGADVGNGRATARLFGRHGATVLVADLDLASAEETARMIREAGGEAGSIEADVTVEADLVAAVAAAVERHGRLDILHNNVGVGPAGGDAPIDRISAAVLDRMMDVNLRGMTLACRHAIPVMRERGGGAITNISSIGAVMNYPNAAYRISKAAILALTKHVAITQAPHGIRANAILPGLISTPMAIERRVAAGESREGVLAKRAAQVPLRGGPGSAWDVARAALFLASDEARFITGAELVVDGGQSLLVG